MGSSQPTSPGGIPPLFLPLSMWHRPEPIRASHSPGYCDWSRGEHQLKLSHSQTHSCTQPHRDTELNWSSSVYEKSSPMDFFNDFWGLTNLLGRSWERIASQSKWLSTIRSPSSLVAPCLPRTTLGIHPGTAKIKLWLQTPPKCFPNKGSYCFQKAILVEPNILSLFLSQVPSKPSINRGHYHSSSWAGNKMDICCPSFSWEDAPIPGFNIPGLWNKRLSMLFPRAETVWCTVLSFNLRFAGLTATRIDKVKLSGWELELMT